MEVGNITFSDKEIVLLNPQSKADIIFEMGKRWIEESSLKDIDRIANIFITELQDINEVNKADELYEVYKQCTGG